MDLSHVTIYQIDQVSIEFEEIYLGEKYPTSSASIFLFVFKK
jgi:hypothetical protein